MNRRIRHTAEYRQFLDAPQFCRLPHFFIPVLPTEDGNFAFGITIGKKHGGAVVRNRFKRRVKAWFTANAEAFPGGLKINLIAKEGAAILTWSDLCQELTQLIAQLNRLAQDLQN